MREKEDKQYTKVNGGCNRKKQKTLKNIFFCLTGWTMPPVLGKGAFPWSETTPCSQAKRHLLAKLLKMGVVKLNFL